MPSAYLYIRRPVDAFLWPLRLATSSSLRRATARNQDTGRWNAPSGKHQGIRYKICTTNNKKKLYIYIICVCAHRIVCTRAQCAAGMSRRKRNIYVYMLCGSLQGIELCAHGHHQRRVYFIFGLAALCAQFHLSSTHGCGIFPGRISDICRESFQMKIS